MPFHIQCECGQVLAIPDDAGGRDGQCPACSRTFTIPRRPPADSSGAGGPIPDGAPLVACSQCGNVNQPGAVYCAACGSALAHPAARPAPMPAGGGMVSRFIPSKNVPALVGYYLAVFALIPCLGIGLGIAAMILGIIGLVRVGKHPEARGKGHAWFAVLFGLLCIIANIVLIANAEVVVETLFDL